MTIKQYIHRKKPGGFQRLTPGKWLTLGLAPTAATANGLLIYKLYSRLEWDTTPNAPAYISGFRVRYRLVRKKTAAKPADPTAYDERTVIFDSERFATHSIEYVGPVRKGEINRQHYWQVMVVPPIFPIGGPFTKDDWIQNLRITTRYGDYWRLV